MLPEPGPDVVGEGEVKRVLQILVERIGRLLNTAHLVAARHVGESLQQVIHLRRGEGEHIHAGIQRRIGGQGRGQRIIPAQQPINRVPPERIEADHDPGNGQTAEAQCGYRSGAPQQDRQVAPTMVRGGSWGG